MLRLVILNIGNGKYWVQKNVNLPNDQYDGGYWTDEDRDIGEKSFDSLDKAVAYVHRMEDEYENYKDVVLPAEKGYKTMFATSGCCGKPFFIGVKRTCLQRWNVLCIESYLFDKIGGEGMYCHYYKPVVSSFKTKKEAIDKVDYLMGRKSEITAKEFVDSASKIVAD